MSTPANGEGDATAQVKTAEASPVKTEKKAGENLSKVSLLVYDHDICLFAGRPPYSPSIIKHQGGAAEQFKKR